MSQDIPVEQPADELDIAQDESAAEASGPTLVADDDAAAALSDELRETTARLKTVSAAYKRLQEEFASFKERQARQQALKEEILKGDVVSRLFEPVENLRRTIDALKRQGADAAVIEGVEMVYANFMDGFTRLGLEAVGEDGERFDPGAHEALTMMPVDRAELDGTVVQVFSKGYKVGARVIRPARVVVGQHTEPAGEA